MQSRELSQKEMFLPYINLYLSTTFFPTAALLLVLTTTSVVDQHVLTLFLQRHMFGLGPPILVIQ